jgi:hypothetical protein
MARKRKSGQRTKSGRLSRAHKGVARDFGTRESEAKRCYLVNGSDNLTLASTPIDVALARGHVTREQHTAAVWLRIMRARVFGRPGARTIDLEGLSSGRTISDKQLEHYERLYVKTMRRLTEEEQLEAIAIGMDTYPRWLRCVIQGAPIACEDARAKEVLLSALDKLKR